MSETTISVQFSYEDMLRAGMHFGRKKTVFNPKMEKYVFGAKEGINIIDLLKTQMELRSAIAFMDEIIKRGGTILIVGITKQSVDGFKDLAEKMNMPYVLDRWLGGTLTNHKILIARVKKLEQMESSQRSGELNKYTKKERLMFEREIKKMESKFGGLRKLAELPDAVFVSSIKEGALPIREAKRMKIKIIAIANTDANPDGIDYVIPANDRSKKSVDLIAKFIKQELKLK